MTFFRHFVSMVFFLLIDLDVIGFFRPKCMRDCAAVMSCGWKNERRRRLTSGRDTRGGEGTFTRGSRSSFSFHPDSGSETLQSLFWFLKSQFGFETIWVLNRESRRFDSYSLNRKHFKKVFSFLFSMKVGAWKIFRTILANFLWHGL